MRHVVELKSERQRSQVSYWGVCACGAESPRFRAAGLVWGWEGGTHADAMAVNRFPYLTAPLVLAAAEVASGNTEVYMQGDHFAHRLLESIESHETMPIPTDPELLALDLWERAVERALERVLLPPER